MAPKLPCDQIYFALEASKSRIREMFPFGFDRRGRVKLNCYAPKMPLNFMMILDHDMKFNKESTIKYSDAGILAAEMFLMYLGRLESKFAENISECIKFDADHDMLRKNGFAVCCGTEFAHSGSVVFDAWDRTIFQFLCEMPRMYRVLYAAFYSRFMFIAHAWMCCCVWHKPDSLEFAGFLSEYGIYMRLLRDLMSYCEALYVDP